MISPSHFGPPTWLSGSIFATIRTMSLCSLCRSIPFENLPHLPLRWRGGVSSIQDHFSMPVFCLDRKLSSGSNEPLGFPHHNSLEVLAASASDCELCGLIYHSTSFVASYREAEKDPVFSHYQSGSGLPCELQLWLTRRLNGGDGFLTFVRARSGNLIFLVCAVGFCVEDGMSW